MDKLTMRDRFLRSIDTMRYFASLSDRLSPGMNANTRTCLMDEGAHLYSVTWTLWQNMTADQQNYCLAWRASDVDLMVEFCQIYVAPYANTKDERYSAESVNYVTTWETSLNPKRRAPGCIKHTVVTINNGEEVETYFSCLGPNQDGQGNDK